MRTVGQPRDTGMSRSFNRAVARASYGRGMTQTTQEHLAPVLADLAALLEGIGDADAAAPTPCSEYTVAQLREHVVQWAAAFAAGFADPGGQCPDPTATSVEGTGADQIREAARGLADADPAGHGLVIGGGELPADMSLSMILSEYQVHGWDLARAVGADWNPAEDGLEASLAFLPHMLTPDFQGEGKSFAPRVDVADDAPALDRLVALTGRDPGWTRERAGRSGR